ncbi:Transcription repressor OFP17 [Striga hermonthica]|uniref:Transcription repressor OFP17 n=1 Tax=Striga hermonthica TaxID=68872 RepID=A0A9N7MZQ2_STRHE|nr:Transcription repressor OFP17 [Striga hermonthica]
MNRGTLKHKLLKSCKKILINLFKFRVPHKPLFIRALRFHRKRPRNETRATTKEKRIPRIVSVLTSLRRARKGERVADLKSFSDAGYHQTAPHPSPITPAYVRLLGRTQKDASDYEHDDDVADESCRSFEKHLVEMIVEEGKMKGLAEVEDLLYSWKNLRCPVFIGLVGRFYGELCNDLF